MTSKKNVARPVELFDIALTRSIGAGQHVPMRTTDPTGSSWREIGVRLLGLSLPDARQVLKAVRDAGGDALIIPIRYRDTHVTQKAARALAHDEFERVRQLGREYGAMTEGRDAGLWWEYRVPDKELEDAGYIPDAVIISIDKYDGHVKVRGEQGNWLRLSEIE